MKTDRFQFKCFFLQHKKNMKNNKNKNKSKKQAPTVTSKERLEGSRFRILNEKLYTTTSSESKELFDKHPEYFDMMHNGFDTQASNWPIVPVDKVIEWIQSNHKKPEIIADMGCGEAKISQSVPNVVHSFDFKAKTNNVVECDMSHTPLEDKCVDVVVFVLSLMGTNLDDFICEARRIIKDKGTLLIIEVTSRIENLKSFISAIEDRGFHNTVQKSLTNYFVWLEFKTSDIKNTKSKIVLKPCLYKRR